eukprot:4333733-Amphidinium_carterae.2
MEQSVTRSAETLDAEATRSVLVLEDCRTCGHVAPPAMEALRCISRDSIESLPQPHTDECQKTHAHPRSTRE